MKNLKDILESLLDVDDNIDNLDNLFKFWKCSSLNQYKKMMDEFEDFAHQFPAKPNAKIYDYILNGQLESGCWYIKFHSGLQARQFTLFKKDDTDYIGCVWERNKVNITLQKMARGFIKTVAHPVQSTFKLPKSFDVWVDELKKYIK